MSEPIWRQNIRDAILLDQLILIHGNVKDLYAVEPTALAQLPNRYRTRPFVNFDIWLALEFERLGYPIVTLYDPVDSVTVLRPAMLKSFTALAAGRALEATPELQPTNASRSLPSANRNSASTDQPEADSWMVRWDVRQDPAAFFRTMYDNVLPRSETPIAAICRFTDRYLSFTDRQQEQDKTLSLLIQKAATVIPPRESGATLQSRIVLIFNTEGEVPQELNVQAPFARSVLLSPPSVEEREDFFRFAASHFFVGDPE